MLRLLSRRLVRLPMNLGLIPKSKIFKDIELIEISEAELKKIIKANEREEIKLRDQRDKVAKDVRKSDYNTYTRVRKACGGKAIVTINRAACTGCHNVVPPQRQIEIRGTKRLYTCESCGRLLISPEIAEEQALQFK